MFNLVERRLTTFQRHHAEEFLKEHNHYCGQRPLRQSHVDYLAGKMAEGLFLQTDIAYARLPDGRSALIDGQHSLNACRQSGIPINVAVCGYEVKDDAEVWSLYAECDAGLRRTQTDVVRASRNIMPADLREIPHNSVSLYGAAILMAPFSGGATVFSSREIKSKRRVMAVCSSAAEALFLHEYQCVEIFNRIPVRMAMLATRRVDTGRASLFWDGVAKPERMTADDPRRLLSSFLVKARRGVSSAVNVRAIYTTCVGHWNAHATGRPLAECLHEVMQGVAGVLAPTIPAPALTPAPAVRFAPRSPLPAYTAAKPSVPVTANAAS